MKRKRLIAPQVGHQIHGRGVSSGASSAVIDLVRFHEVHRIHLDDAPGGSIAPSGKHPRPLPSPVCRGHRTGRDSFRQLLGEQHGATIGRRVGSASTILGRMDEPIVEEAEIAVPEDGESGGAWRAARLIAVIAGVAALVWAMRDRFISLVVPREPERPTFRVAPPTPAGAGDIGAGRSDGDRRDRSRLPESPLRSRVRNADRGSRGVARRVGECRPGARGSRRRLGEQGSGDGGEERLNVRAGRGRPRPPRAPSFDPGSSR